MYSERLRVFERVMYVSEIRLAEVKHTRGKGNVSAQTLVLNLRYLFTESWFLCWRRGSHSVPLDCSAFPHERMAILQVQLHKKRLQPAPDGCFGNFLVWVLLYIHNLFFHSSVVNIWLPWALSLAVTRAEARWRLITLHLELYLPPLFINDDIAHVQGDTGNDGRRQGSGRSYLYIVDLKFRSNYQDLASFT